LKQIVQLLNELGVDKSKYTVLEKEDEFQVIATKIKKISMGKLRKESLTVYIEKKYTPNELNKKINNIYDFLNSNSKRMWYKWI